MIQIGPDYLRVYSELLSREYRYIKIYDVDVCLVRILPGKGFRFSSRFLGYRHVNHEEILVINFFSSLYTTWIFCYI